MAAPNRSPIRVLVRPSQSQTQVNPPVSQLPASTHSLQYGPPLHPHAAIHTLPTSLTPWESGSSHGITVVGFIGGRKDDLDSLLNRLLDLNVFGSGNLAKELHAEADESWFSSRRISYYVDEDSGIMYVQLYPTHCPAMSLASERNLDLDAFLEKSKFEDIQGLLFMFCVCHVIINMQDGSYFDTEMLKKLRILQAAKYGIVRPPYTRTFPSRDHSLSSSSTHVPAVNTLKTGSTSNNYFFPGQCIPVLLFVFLDDFLCTTNSSFDRGNAVGAPVSSQFSKSNSPATLSIPAKGSSQIIVLSRPSNKSEHSFKRKLQSSLEAQIRFLIKRCRILSGHESRRSGLRHTSAPNAAPLFSLDASRLVVLLEKCANQPVQALTFATGLLDEVLDMKASSDLFWQEAHFQNANNSDLQAIQEFIYRQNNILKGRENIEGSGSTGPPAAVGMVATASVAASSAMPRRKATTPQLPGLETWLFESKKFLQELLSAKGGLKEDFFISREKAHQHYNLQSSDEMDEMCPAETAVSFLEEGTGLNMRFSTSWCQKALPAAKDVYLNELPERYPTSVHEAHLKKALQAFCSMVKGPAVEYFTKKLKDDCILTWKSGRQQCDAISLTGNPCILQRHDARSDVVPHNSGYFFLHACCCGRTRKLRPDPFDFESANNSLKLFDECDNILPILQLPSKSQAGPIQPSSWSLVRIGSARYYDPLKGLLQSGFCPSEKYLLRCKISPGKKRNTSEMLDAELIPRSALDANAKDELVEHENAQGVPSTLLLPGEKESPLEDQGNLQKFKGENKMINAGKGFPRFILKKPFSEVVAGSTAPNSNNLQFQQMKYSIYDSDGRLNKHHLTEIKVPDTFDNQETQSSIDAGPIERTKHEAQPHVSSFGRQIIQKAVSKHVIICVGFEHECPCGHRFILSQEHLSVLESSHVNLKGLQAQHNVPLNGSLRSINVSHGKVQDGGVNVTLASDVKNLSMSKGSMQSSSSTFVPNLDQTSGYVMIGSTDGSTVECFKSLSIEDGECSSSLLNRDLPLYMSCPHCRIMSHGNQRSTTKFANAISQLQRIFLVTPPLPVIIASCPIVQFVPACLAPFPLQDEQFLRFSLGCQVILPPDSFITLRLPFIYGVQLENQVQHALMPLDLHPELTALVVGGTTVRVLSGENA